MFAVEASVAGWGKASIAFNNSLRLRSAGLNGAWSMTGRNSGSLRAQALSAGLRLKF